MRMTWTASAGSSCRTCSPPRVRSSGDERERLLAEHADSDPELVEQARSLLARRSRPGLMDDLAPQFASVARCSTRPRRLASAPTGSCARSAAAAWASVYLADRADGEFQQRVAIKLIATSDARRSAAPALPGRAADPRRARSIRTSRGCSTAASPRTDVRTSSWSTSTACRSRPTATRTGSTCRRGCGSSSRSAPPSSTRTRTWSSIATSSRATSWSRPTRACTCSTSASPS